MTAPKHLASSPLVTLEDIERVSALVWAWLAARCLSLATWVMDDPAGEWERIADPIDAYGEALTVEGLTALRLEELDRVIAEAGTGSYPVVALESSLLRPGVTAGLEVSK